MDSVSFVQRAYFLHGDTKLSAIRKPAIFCRGIHNIYNRFYILNKAGLQVAGNLPGAI